MLAFWTQDEGQIDRIFRQSALMREKWDKRHHSDGQTYGQATIQIALNTVSETYQPRAGGAKPNDIPEPPPWTTEEVSFEAYARAGDAEDFDPDVYQAPPSLDPKMLYGIAGEFAKHAALKSEVSRVAAAANVLALIACNAGRDTYQYIGDTVHHAAIYTMHVGRTSIGGKGDALSLVDRVVMRIEDLIRQGGSHKDKKIPPDLLCNNHSGGLSSSEGLIMLIHDGISTLEKGAVVETTPPIPDKRLLITETEFSNVLHQARRTGNTLTSRLRDSFDGKPLMPPTKQNRIGCREPHICIRAGITPYELLDLLEQRDIANGFFNRFLVFWAEREKIEPFPQTTEDRIVQALAEDLIDVILFAKGAYPRESKTREITATPTARDLFAHEYRAVYAKRTTTERTMALAARHRVYAWRFAHVFALTDLTAVIDEKHIEAAIAWTRYSRQSLEFIFNSEVGARDTEKTQALASKILEFLRTQPDGATATEISGHFNRHVSAAELKVALKELIDSAPRVVEMKTDCDKSATGRPPKIYRAIATEVCE
jgi:hypothetical protein